jgi:aryl-alcohol dehydrogenase-like predicted oxidoreductase
MTKLERREFLHRAALGVGGLLVAGTGTGAAQQRPAVSRFDPFELVPLGRTSLKVSRVCLGTGTRGGNRESNFTRMGAARFEALVRESLDRGTRLFDVADSYGTHPFIAPALKGIPRDRYNVATKIWFAPSGGIPEAERPDAEVVVARFLRELKTDHLDLVLLHCVMSSTWPAELRRYMDALSKLKEKGDIRAVGVSCHSIAALEAAAAEPWVDSVHARINPFGMSMDGSPEQVVPVLKKIHAAGKGVIGMKIIGEGRLRNDDERKDASIRYALTLGCVDVLNVGCESLAELDDLAARVRRVERKT